jgi:S1-C subfamily serine protease
MTFPTVVRVSRPGGDGSGVFVEDDLVVTAGHVLQPHPGLFDPDDYSVVLANGTRLGVKAVLTLRGWSNGFHSSADMGVLRLKSKRPSLVADFLVDQPIDQQAVVVGGCGALQFSGTATRVGSSTDFDMVSSSDLAFPRGVSGGPIVDAGDTILGIATRSASSPQLDLLIGLPFLAETLDWLREHCP